MGVGGPGCVAEETENVSRGEPVGRSRPPCRRCGDTAESQRPQARSVVARSRGCGFGRGPWLRFQQLCPPVARRVQYPNTLFAQQTVVVVVRRRRRRRRLEVDMPSSHIPPYLVGFTLVTAGQDKENLGADEAEIIAVSWAVVDTNEPKLVAVHDSLVQPDDLSKVNWDAVKEKGIIDVEVQKAPRLSDVLGQFDVYSKQSLYDSDGQPAFVLVTDGALPLRQVLHPEALRKDIHLGPAFANYFDIRKEIRRLSNNNEDPGVCVSLRDAMDLTSASVPGLTRSTDDSAPQSESKDMGVAIIKTLLDAKAKGLEDGCFREPDRVKLHLEHGICTKDDVIDSNLVVRARGLPWQSSDQDVAKFFVGLNIAKAGVALCLSREGRRNGEALVLFETREHRDMALRRHRHFMGNRYIEIYRATGEDFIEVAAGRCASSRGAGRRVPADDRERPMATVISSGAGELPSSGSGDESDSGRRLLIEFVETAVRQGPCSLAQLRDRRHHRRASMSCGTYSALRSQRLWPPPPPRHSSDRISNGFSNRRRAFGTSLGPRSHDQPLPYIFMRVAGTTRSARRQYSCCCSDERAVSMGYCNNSEAQEFLTRGAEVIIRMRGLPYDATAKQILDFFSAGDNGCEVMEGERGVLFVNKTDGRATGDAFVLFASEADAQKALTKHKDIIGTRYIELFRSTTAEVQQVINKSMEPHRSESLSLAATGLVGAVPTGVGLAGSLPALMPQQVVISGNRKDCIRLRGLPYEAQVQHILEFLGDFSKHIVFQGVHMVYNSQGHPSGEAFIQMDSEQAAAASSADRHNKYMQIAKKQRYIEVFQCSADDMNLVLTGPTSGPVLPGGMGQTRLPLSPGATVLPTAHPGLTSQAFSQGNLINMQMLQQFALQNQLAGARPMFGGHAGLNGGMIPVLNTHQGPVVYWPYPSPPVSPSNSFYAAQAQAAAAAAMAAQQSMAGPAIVLMRGLPFNASTTDILAFFQGYSDVTAECVQIQRAANGSPTGDALVTFGTRMEAERAVVEKNRVPLGPRPIELFLYSI
uniref:RRM domain-containing protein n=1 Tax=Plectus sambesii TaxID=2011161 RepID=A0A914W4Q5_9BILA